MNALMYGAWDISINEGQFVIDFSSKTNPFTRLFDSPFNVFKGILPASLDSQDSHND